MIAIVITIHANPATGAKMTSGPLSTELKRVVRERMGPNAAKRFNPGQIRRWLGLSEDDIDRETFRKVWSESYEPSQAVADRVREKLKATAGPVFPPNGRETCKLVSSFLGSGNALFTIERQSGADLYVRVSLGGHLHLIRCVEDEPSPAFVQDTYFDPHVVDIEEKGLGTRYESATLLTHRTFSPNSVAQRSKKGVVNVMRVSEFVGRFFPPASILEKMRARLSEAGLQRDGAERAIPAVFLESNQRHVDNVLEEVFNELSDDEPVALAILGHPGSGKSSLLRRISVRIIENTVSRLHASFPLPVIVKPRHITSTIDVIRSVSMAVEEAYDQRVEPELLRHLIHEGRLIVLIDALDECPMLSRGYQLADFLRAVRGLMNGASKIVLTLRPEMFSTADREAATFEQHAILRVLLHPLTEREALAGLAAHVGAAAAERLQSSDESSIGGPIRDLIRTPYFLEVVRSVSSIDWISVAAGTTPPERRTTQIFQLFTQYAAEWMDREALRAVGSALGLSSQDRMNFCEIMACLSIDPVVDGEVGIDLLERAVRQHYFVLGARTRQEAVDAFDGFLRDAQLSMFLIREGDVFRFAHQSIRNYFYGCAIAKDITDRDRKFRALGVAPLRRSMALTPAFVYGFLKQFNDQPIKLSNELLDNIRENGLKNGNSTSVTTTVANLVFLIQWMSFNIAVDAKISLKHLALPFANLDSIIVDDTTHHAISVENANVEYAESQQLAALPPALGPIHATLRDVKPLRLAERMTRIGELREYCWKNGLLNKGTQHWGGCEWAIVPGGRWQVVLAKPRETQSRSTAGGVRTAGHSPVPSQTTSQRADVLIPSFLMMRHPVTNGQFLQFVQSNPERSPFRLRVSTGKDYQLRGWDRMLRERQQRDVKEWVLKELPADWLCAPLVYVDWESATAFASFHGWFLPTEAEYEIAGRMYLSDDVMNSRLSLDGPNDSDFPWGTSADVEKFAICATPGKETSLLPNWDCTVAGPKDASGSSMIPLFERWLNENREIAQNVPFHLVGGVREWVACAWSANWPLYRHRAECPELSPYNDGLAALTESADSPSAARRVLLPSEVADTYTLRGGSFHLRPSECRLSYRAPLSPGNVNPDAGFRCTRSIFPTRGLGAVNTEVALHR